MLTKLLPTPLIRISTTTAIFVALLLAVGASAASAADIYTYKVTLGTLTYSNPAPGEVQVGKLDGSKTTRVRWLRAGLEQGQTNHSSGNSSVNPIFPLLATGDQLEVQQPAGTVVETFTIPALGISGAAGSVAVSGTAPDAVPVFVDTPGTCFGNGGADVLPVATSGGHFSINYPRALLAGDPLELVVFPGKGDSITYQDRLAGESPCFDIDAASFPPYPGESPDPAPFQIRADNLHKSVTTTARLVMARGGSNLVDVSYPTVSDQINQPIAPQPLPGDVISLYRPSSAAAPSASFTVPAVSATYDTGNNLFAVTAPAAGLVEAWVVSRFVQGANVRSQTNSPAGRTVFDFNLPLGYNLPMPLTGGTAFRTFWSSPDLSRRITVNATAGDLTAPTLKLRLASSFRLSRIAKKLSVTVTASEVSKAKLVLTVPASAKSHKLIKVAVVSRSLKAGSNKVRLKLTSSGKKLVKALRAKGRKLKPLKGLLTVTATDASGNSTTATKKTKVVAG